MEEYCDDSQIFNEKNAIVFKNEDDIWNNNSSQVYASTEYYNNFTNISELERDDIHYLKKSSKLDTTFDENLFKNSLFDGNNGCIFKKNNLMFSINKRHSYKCKHLSKISKSVRKNKVKLSLEDDFTKIFSYNFDGFNNKFGNIKKNFSQYKSFEKNSKIRNLRLFDKDVITKKIICHFYKFSTSLVNFLEKNFKIKIKINETIKLKKKNQLNFKKILNIKIAELSDKCNEYTLPQHVNDVLSMTCLNLYKEFYLNSNYFYDITQNFKFRYGDFYYQTFINLCDEFTNQIYYNITKNTNKKNPSSNL